MSVEDCNRLAFGSFVLDRRDERLIGPSGPIKLGNKALRVLLTLIDEQGRLVTKDALFTSVWDGMIVSESALTSTVKELRRALGDGSKTPTYIESVYGRGYRFIAPVHAADDPEPVAEPAPGPALGNSARLHKPAEEGMPPVVLVSAFDDKAIRQSHPHIGIGLREEVISGLSRFREIQLVADNRSEEDAKQAHRAERGYQLTATLLPGTDGVKVLARATRLTDGRVVWAETMGLADTGTAGGVETIVRRIAGAALPAVDEDLIQGLHHETPDLYDRYLIAKRRSLTARTFNEAQAAARELEAVIAERPDFGLAYPPLCRLYNTDFGYTGLGSSGPTQRARAFELARQGLAADRANVHAFTLLGFCYLWHDQRALARKCFDQALALNPFFPIRLQECAGGLMFLGDLPGARHLMDQAAALNPVPEDQFFEDLGLLFMLEGDFDAARAALASIITGTIWAELYLSVCEIRLGSEDGETRFAAWLERVKTNWHCAPSPGPAELLAWIRYHHPLPPDTAADFFTTAEAAVGRGRAISRSKAAE